MSHWKSCYIEIHILYETISGFLCNRTLVVDCRQAFIHYCGLHQVQGRTEKLHPYMGSNRFTEHAQNLLGGVKKENPGEKGGN